MVFSSVIYLLFSEGKEAVSPHELRKVPVDELVDRNQQPLTVEQSPNLLNVHIGLEKQQRPLATKTIGHIISLLCTHIKRDVVFDEFESCVFDGCQLKHV